MRSYAGYRFGNGEEIGVSHPLLQIFLLKYVTSETAIQAFKRFDKANDLIVDGIKIKGVEKEDHPGSATYVLYSNNFIIWVNGNIEAAKDSLSRILELYSVPKDN